jgi:hypothetical protein
VKKGQKKPVEIARLLMGSTITEQDTDAIALAMKLKQVVTVRLGVHANGSSPQEPTFAEPCIILEARPS